MTTEQIWTDAIVLRAVDYGESDRIFGLLTREYGKISIFAKGARNSKKRYAGVDLFVSFSACLMPPRGQSGFFQLTNLQNLNLNLNLRQDVMKFSQVSYMAECTWSFMGEQDAQRSFYEWFLQTLNYIQTKDFRKEDQVRMDLEMLRWFGYLPSLSICFECQRTFDNERAFFAFSKGSLTCKDCHSSAVGQWIHTACFKGDRIVDFRGSLNAFVNFTLGRAPKSQKVREELLYVG